MKIKLMLMTGLFILSLNMSYTQNMLSYAGDPKPFISEPGTKNEFLFEFKAYSKELELEVISTEMAGVHIFGELAARKVFLMDKRYTSEVPVVPGNPQTRTIIKKPVVYDAVRRIEKELTKNVKKGEKSLDVASTEFNRVLDVALNILTVDTKAFEETINKTDNVSGKIELFTKQVKLNYEE